MCECADIGHLACQVRGANSLISKLLRLLRGHFWIVVAHHLLEFHQVRQNLECFFRIAREDIAYLGVRRCWSATQVTLSVGAAGGRSVSTRSRLPAGSGGRRAEWDSGSLNERHHLGRMQLLHLLTPRTRKSAPPQRRKKNPACRM